MKRPVVAALAVVALVLVAGLGWWATARWREEPADALSMGSGDSENWVSVTAEAGVPMSWSLSDLVADPDRGPVTVTDVTVDADESMTLLGVGWIDTRSPMRGMVTTDFPPESFFEEIKGTREHYHSGLPAGPLPRGEVGWTPVLGLTVDRAGPSRLRAMHVTYEVDGEEHVQTFELRHTVCAYVGSAKDVDCDPVFDKAP